MNNHQWRRISIGAAVIASLLPLSGCIVIVDRDDSRGYSYSDRNGKRLGIEVDSVGNAVAAQTGVMPGTGLLITGVVPGSPAHAAGLQRFDVIKSVEGQPDGTLKSLRAALKARSPGESLTLAIVRGGQEQTVAATLAAFDD